MRTYSVLWRNGIDFTPREIDFGGESRRRSRPRPRWWWCRWWENSSEKIRDALSIPLKCQTRHSLKIDSVYIEGRHSLAQKQNFFLALSLSNVRIKNFHKFSASRIDFSRSVFTSPTLTWASAWSSSWSIVMTRHNFVRFRPFDHHRGFRLFKPPQTDRAWLFLAKFNPLRPFRFHSTNRPVIACSEMNIHFGPELQLFSRGEKADVKSVSLSYKLIINLLDNSGFFLCSLTRPWKDWSLGFSRRGKEEEEELLEMFCCPCLMYGM